MFKLNSVVSILGLELAVTVSMGR